MSIQSGKEQARQYVSNQSDRVTDSLRTNVQEIDFHAEDLLELPTLVTAIGLLFVYDGSKDLSKVENIHQIRDGRLLDIVDGIIARFLNKESDAGALADVVADKLGLLVLAIQAWVQDALSKKLITYLAVKNIAHTLLTFAASINHPGESFRTPRSNKNAMFLENLGAGLLLEANAYENEQPEKDKHTIRKVIGRAAIGVSIVFEVSALTTMIKRVSKDHPIE